MTRVLAERATRLLFSLAGLAVMGLGGCGGGASTSSPASVVGAISVAVAPPTSSVQVAGAQTFSATVANDSANKGVTWTLSGAGCIGATCGTLSANSSASGVAVTYTAPGAVPSPAGVTLTATSVADGSKTASAVITVTAAPPVIGVTILPTTATVAAGSTQSFTATVTNDSQNKGVSWSLSNPNCGGAFCGTLSATTSASGAPITYTAPGIVPSQAPVMLIATSLADGSKSASAAITITTGPVIAVGISPMTASVPVGQTSNFIASVTNDSQNKGVSWTLSGTGCSGAACGSVSPATSASGAPVTYTAPGSVPVPATVTLTATSVADSTKFVAAGITVTAGAPITVSLTPKRGGLALGQSLSFTATVINDVGAAGVMWSATTSTFSAQTTTTATYVAPNSPGSITVTATSIADGTKTASATIGVTDLAGVTTYHNHLSRDGANTQEYALNTSNVTTGTFGKLFSCTVSGAVYAQPLWVPNVNIGGGGGTHNVIVVATQRDWVYVFDADASPCTTYWSTQFIPAGETYVNNQDFVTNGVGTEDIYPDIGITGTPVIDLVTNTIYFVAKTKNVGTTTAHQRLFAVNLITGQNATSSPVDISVSVAGNCDGGSSVAFNPLMQNQRPGLALLNGVVYVGWGSHGDVGNWHGWLTGFQTTNLTAAPSKFLTTPNGLASPVANAPACGGGIWMSGGAPAIDASNNLYVLTGNGAWDNTVADYSDSYVKLSTPGLGVLDWFTPSNQLNLDQGDTDVGSSGTAVLIDQTSGPNQRLLVGASKGQVFFVLNRDAMGHFNSGGDAVVQEFNLDGHSFSTPGFWNNNVYFFGVPASFSGGLAGETLAFDPVARTFGSTATHHTPATFGFPGATPSISASSATTDGIVWAIDTSAYGTNDHASRTAGPAILHAFDAANISTELWNSSQAAGDKAGNAVKFTVPTVANGKVYIGTRGSDDSTGNGTTFGEIEVYGLLPN